MAIPAPRLPSASAAGLATQLDAARSAWEAHRPPGTLPAEVGKPQGSSKPAPLKGGVVLSDLVIEGCR